MCTYCFEALFNNWNLKKLTLGGVRSWRGRIAKYAIQNNIKMHHGPLLPRQTVVGFAENIANMRVKYGDHRDQSPHLPLGRRVVNSRTRSPTVTAKGGFIEFDEVFLFSM